LRQEERKLKDANHEKLYLERKKNLVAAENLEHKNKGQHQEKNNVGKKREKKGRFAASQKSTKGGAISKIELNAGEMSTRNC